MKTKALAMVLILILAVPLMAAPPDGSRRPLSASSATIDNEQYINVNRILMFVTNHGNFGRDLSGVFGYDAGTFFPYSTVEAIENGSQTAYCNYASGLWIGGKVDGETRVIISEYSDEYVPGPMANETYQADNPAFKLYKLYRDSLADNPNSDYLNWPYDQGAPWDTLDNGDRIPDMVGDQMLWSVYNDANPAQHGNDAGKTEPLGIEVRQSTFAFDRQGALGNIIFVRLGVYNKGPNTIEDCYISLWADPDLGGYTDDFVGCDTLLSLGYVYNGDNSDTDYGTAIPCMGYDFFQGPMEPGLASDTARMWGQLWPGFTNRGMDSFNKYINGTDPNDYNETYNYMQGLAANGDPYVFDGDTLLYMHSGDPVVAAGDPTYTGDLDADPADRRWMQSTGPITFEPGDSTEIIAAIIVGHGSDRFESITRMKELDEFAQIVYENNFNPPEAPAKPNVGVAAELSGEIVLAWGKASEVEPGDYIFEGYTVWQGESETGPWTELATYDLPGGYSDALIDSTIDSYSGVKVPWIRRALSDNGLAYTYSTTYDALTGGPLRDVTTYYFRVTAFSFAYAYLPEGEVDSVIVPDGDRFLESQTVLTLIPQGRQAGTRPSHSPNDVLSTTHTNGTSDIIISPIVLDPYALTGDSYLLWFEDTGTDTVWHLTNTTDDSVLLQDQTNMSGDDLFLPTEGFQLVLEMAQGVVGIDEVATADGPLASPDNVMWSLNSTREWYVGSDDGSNFERLNWRHHIGIADWEFRFTDSAGGSQYYDFNTDGLMPGRCPFEVWNIGEGTPDDPSDDVRIDIAYLDDDASGSWSWGDRIYLSENPYSEPAPDPMVYVWDDDFKLGRIVFNHYDGTTSAPDSGTVVRFVTAKLVTENDTFTFVATSAMSVSGESELDRIRVVPNPFYLYGPYDAAVGNYEMRFHNLPAKCTITIYNLAGEYIDVIEKNDASTGIATWGGRTGEGLPVASGIYIYVVDAPKLGQKIGKFAVFMEKEVLKQY